MSDNSASSGGAGDIIRTVAKTVNAGVKTPMTILDVGGGADGSSESAWTGSVNSNDGSGSPINSLSAGAGQNGLMVALGATNFFYSTVNTSTAQLAPGQIFPGAIETAEAEPAITFLCTSDQPLILTVLQYVDILGVNLADVWTYLVTPDNAVNISRILNGNYVKVTAQNVGPNTTTLFNLNVAYGAIMPVTNLGNLPVALNEINGVAIAPGAGLPVTVISSSSVPDPATLAATSSDGPLFQAITGDPAGDFANVDFMSALFDDTLGLAARFKIVNQPAVDVNGRILVSDAPVPIPLNGVVNGQLVIDTTGYQSLNITTYVMQATVSCSNDLVNWSALSGTAALIINGYVTTISSGSYSFPCLARWIKLTVTGAGNATAYLRAQPWASGYVAPAPVNINQIGGTASAAAAGQIALGITVTPSGTSFATVVLAPATPVSQLIKNSGGRLMSMSVSNSNSTGVWLKLFNASTATVGTTTPVYNVYIPPTASYALPIPSVGMSFSSGIIWAVTGAIAVLDATAITASTCSVSATYI
jgi:hypothetical protein